MLKTLPVKTIILFALIASFIYLIFVGIFLSQRSYDALWILYIGNVLFAMCIVIFLYLFKTNGDSKLIITRMVVSGIIVTVTGILITCFIVLLAALIFPNVFHSFNSISAALNDASPQTEGIGTNYLLPIILNAVIGNVSTGSFFSIIMPFGQSTKKISDSTIS